MQKLRSLLNEGWIGVDLDATLAKYSGYKGPGIIGAPIKVMADRVKQWLADGKKVKIFTARAAAGKNREKEVKAIQDWTEKYLGVRLEVTNEKDKDLEAIWDDRAVQVQKNTGKKIESMQQLKSLVDYSSFMAELHNAATAAGFITKVLGKVDGEPILCLSKLQSPETASGKRKVLIAAGFHGNEVSGPWCVLEWLKQFGSTPLAGVDVTILPLVNPDGFKNNIREDNIDDDPNRGWTKNPEQHASKEGVVLLSHIQELYDASLDGFLTLHENMDSKFFVITIDEKGLLSEKLKEAGSLFFDTEQTMKPKDDTFEVFLNNLGVPIVAVSEIPRNQEFSERVACGAFIIKNFIEYYDKMEWNT
jgi:hypothetical protein